MPTGHPTVCRALLTDGRTRCSSLVKLGRQSCLKHASGYDTSYERYKRAESAAKGLRAAAQTKRGDVHTIPSEEIEPRIESVRAYIKALESELWLRKEHDARFIGNPDEGHRKRLDALEKQLAHHRDIVDALHARLQRLKPGILSPSKHRSHHRHTLSDPTPQPASSATRLPRRRSCGQPKQRRGAHKKSRSDQSGPKKQGEDRNVSMDRGKGASKGKDSFDDIMKRSRPASRESEGGWTRDRLGRGSEMGSLGGSEAERDEDESETASIAIATAGWEDYAIPSDNVAATHAVGAANASPLVPTPIQPNDTRRKSSIEEEEDTRRQPPEANDNFASCAAPSSPHLRVVREYPQADSESQGTGTGGGEKHRTSRHGILKYALTAVLPVVIICLNRTLATLRDRASKL